MPALLRFGRAAAILALALAYAFLAHYTNTRPHTQTLGTMVALAPIMLALASMAWHSDNRKSMLALFGLACLLLAACWSQIKQYYGLIYWMEHAGTELVLCLVFARTLRDGREPMCSYFARMVHGSLSPEMQHYTRQVTQAWVVFFAMMAATSTFLFLAAPLAVWSVFANFFTAPLIGLMFAVEYAVRRIRLPDIQHAHIIDGIKAFWNQPAR